jgi:hypothetical protein
MRKFPYLRKISKFKGQIENTVRGEANSRAQFFKKILGISSGPAPLEQSRESSASKTSVSQRTILSKALLLSAVTMLGPKEVDF